MQVLIRVVLFKTFLNKFFFKTYFKHQIKLNILFFKNNLKQMFKTLFFFKVFLILFSRGEGNTPVTFYTTWFTWLITNI